MEFLGDSVLQFVVSVYLFKHFPEHHEGHLTVGRAGVVSKVSLHTSLVAHQAGTYPGFSSMKRLGVFLLPPGWDASPSQGYPQHQIRRYPFIHLGGERHCESEVSCPRTQHNTMSPGSAPESSALTMRPPRPHTASLVDVPNLTAHDHLTFAEKS